MLAAACRGTQATVGRWGGEEGAKTGTDGEGDREVDREGDRSVSIGGFSILFQLVNVERARRGRTKVGPRLCLPFVSRVSSFNLPCVSLGKEGDRERQRTKESEKEKGRTKARDNGIESERESERMRERNGSWPQQ